MKPLIFKFLAAPMYVFTTGNLRLYHLLTIIPPTLAKHGWQLQHHRASGPSPEHRSTTHSSRSIMCHKYTINYMLCFTQLAANEAESQVWCGWWPADCLFCAFHSQLPCSISLSHWTNARSMQVPQLSLWTMFSIMVWSVFFGGPGLGQDISVNKLHDPASMRIFIKVRAWVKRPPR